MPGPKAWRALSTLLSYPGEHTTEAAELLFVILQGEHPEAAREISSFGAFLEEREAWQIEEVFTGTFDINPACALEIGWHIFGEEYARGLFLVRMREEMRKYGITESSELPDHVSHVLAVLAAMPPGEADRFVKAIVQPAVKKMRGALDSAGSPYARVVTCLDLVLAQVWPAGSEAADGTDSCHPDTHAIPAGVDPLHAFPVADVGSGCGGGCTCSSTSTPLTQIEPMPERKGGTRSQ